MGENVIPAGQAAWAGKSILVVDDYPSIRKSMKELVQSLGLRFREAENGLEALEALKLEKPDVVLSDLVMPEMDGFELTEALKASPEWRQIPVIIISTHSDARYIFKALRLGADDYLTKPATKEMLTLVMNRLFDHEW
ncbi:MAG: response regulator [Pseudomonadota bacterium]